MASTLIMPYRSLSIENYISRGSAGHVFALNDNLVIKCATKFDNPRGEQEQEMRESRSKIQHEASVYDLSLKQPRRHPNIVHCVFSDPEGIILERLQSTLEQRLEQGPIPVQSQFKWIQQLTSALAWIESLNLVHGDLRPANIFVDNVDNIRIGDFDGTVRPGEDLKMASEPFCRLDENFNTPKAGVVSDEFALGSCIYNIRFGRKPLDRYKSYQRVRMLIQGEFPSTEGDEHFGDLISKCWHGNYTSINDIDLDVARRLKDRCTPINLDIDTSRDRALRAEYDQYIDKISKEHLTC